MTTPHVWIWQQPDWPRFRWDQGALAPVLARARLAQGKVLGAMRSLDPNLTLEAVAAIIVEDGVTTSAIEGERLDLDAVRSSVARHLGLSTARRLTRTAARRRWIDRDAARCHPAPRSPPDGRTAVRLASLLVSCRPFGFASNPNRLVTQR